MNTVSMLLLLSVALDTSLNAVFGKWGVGGGGNRTLPQCGEGWSEEGGGTVRDGGGALMRPLHSAQNKNAPPSPSDKHHPQRMDQAQQGSLGLPMLSDQ